MLGTAKQSKALTQFSDPDNKSKTFRSLNWVSRKNDYNRIKSENMRMISKIQNVKSVIDTMNIKQHQRQQDKLRKLIQKNTSISQMIENSRYKIAYSSF